MMPQKGEYTMRTAATFLTVVCLLAPTFALNAYYIGNSLTDNINYGTFESAAEAAGEELSWGRHMIPGAPLDWILGHSESGFCESPYGYYPNALGNYTWDVITMQPYDRKLDSDINSVGEFISQAAGRSPNARFFIYAQWPLQNGDYEELWFTPYTGSWDKSNLRCKDYYERLTRGCREAYPQESVHMVPNGHVLYELHKLALSGSLPGFSSAFGFYLDATHLNTKGTYVVGCTMYAVLFKKNPEGLPHDAYGISAEAARIIQNTAWDVVTGHELTGVSSGATAARTSGARAPAPRRTPLPRSACYTIDGRRTEPLHSGTAQGAGRVLIGDNGRLYLGATTEGRAVW